MHRQQNLAGYLFIMPSLLGVLLFFCFPMIFTLVLSFTDWQGLSLTGTNFIGFGNYKEMADSPRFWAVIGNTFLFILYVPIAVIIGFFLAMILNKSVYLKSLLRALYFMPYITGGIAVAFVWMLLFHPSQGPVNNVLMSIGISEPPVWLASADTAMYAIIIIMVWFSIGFNMIIYLASIQDVPQEIIESAKIDGANTFQIARYITFPIVSPITFFLLVIGFITGFKMFGMIYAVTGGGPSISTTVLALDIYVTAFRYYELGYAASLSVILFTFVFIITLIQFYVQKRWVHY